MNFDWFKQQFEAWIERRQARRECDTCNVLKEQLFITNSDKTKLLEQLIEITNPKSEPVEPIKEYEPIKPRIMPWRVKQSMLEAESRAEAKILRERAAANKVDDLEAEVMKLAEEKLPIEEKVNG